MTENEIPAVAATPDDLPWYERPYLPRVNASLIVTRDHPIDTFDRPMDGAGTSRVVGVHVGDLTIHVGSIGGDAEIVAVAGELIRALALLQDNAIRRQSETLAVPT